MQSSEVKTDRRSFLKRASAGAAGGIITATTLSTLTSHSAFAAECIDDPHLRPRHGMPGGGYGPLQRTRDQNGDEILALPAGFQYVTFSKTGDMMDDGFPTPGIHDGMACFAMPDGTVRLIRNHEARNAAGNFNFGVIGREWTRYDARAAGGCVALDFHPGKKKLKHSFTAINGTLVNCSGGLSYQDTGWLTCEETTSGIAQGYEKNHGYTFLVLKEPDRTNPAQALTAMGRFAKEGALADDGTGLVYQTEDSGNNSGFYRFVPNDVSNLAAGGVLQMLAIQGRPGYNTITNQIVGQELAVQWMTIDSPDPAVITSTTSCFAQGLAKGGARFNRLEGLYRGGDGSIFFVSTSGGNAGRGQLWQYVPTVSGNGALVLVYESPGSAVLDSPDNICVTPSGGILFCEDDASGDNDTHLLAPGLRNVDRLIGLSRSGQPFEFAVNIFSESEFCGACFSPDGEILFVNIQGGQSIGSGMTIAIWGPWRRGPL